jgi:hypothetical protein
MDSEVGDDTAMHSEVNVAFHHFFNSFISLHPLGSCELYFIHQVIYTICLAFYLYNVSHILVLCSLALGQFSYIHENENSKYFNF